MNSANFEEKISKWFMDQKFYHGYLPREDLPYVLKKKGDYIVRTAERTTPKGKRRDYILSIAWPQDAVAMITSTKEIKNILIERSANACWIDLSSSFSSPDSLLNHYRRNDIVNQNKERLRLIRPMGLMSWEYKHSQIQCVKKVGQGAYGEVYKGKVRRVTNNKTFDAAIKAMRKDLDAGDEKMKEVMAEARLMRSLNHPNIVRCRGIAVLEQPLYIVIDFITGGGLDSFLKKNASKLTMDEKNKMAISAAWGIEFMHSHDIIHRDIAARNCLYDKKNLVKLSDFGLSRKGSPYRMTKSMKMPTRWLAPESLSTFTFSRASDVYTYGVLLYEIYTCQEPFQNINGGEARNRILSGSFPNFEKHAPAELNAIVKSKVYQLDPNNRAPMNEIVKQLEQWLEVELVLEEDEKQEAEIPSSRYQNEDSQTGAKKKGTSREKAPARSPASGSKTPRNEVRGSNRQREPPGSKEPAVTREPVREQKEQPVSTNNYTETGNEQPSTKTVTKTVVAEVGDRREMEELKPPEEEPRAGSPKDKSTETVYGDPNVKRRSSGEPDKTS